MKEMFESSVDGQPYDPDKWGAYYKPNGFQASAKVDDSDNDAPAPAAKVSVPPVVEDDEPAVATAPVQAAPAAKSSPQRAEDILAMIRSRKQ
jgi:hypothetical protein